MTPQEHANATIERFEPNLYGDTGIQMDGMPHGEWVRYSDHAAELHRANEEVERLKGLTPICPTCKTGDHLHEASAGWWCNGCGDGLEMKEKLIEALRSSLQSKQMVIDSNMRSMESVRVLAQVEIDAFQSDIATLTAENAALREEVNKIKAEEAYVRLQRDALLEITWLDGPAEPWESTNRWREVFEEGWTRKADLTTARARIAELEEGVAEALDCLINVKSPASAIHALKALGSALSTQAPEK